MKAEDTTIIHKDNDAGTVIRKDKDEGDSAKTVIKKEEPHSEKKVIIKKDHDD